LLVLVFADAWLVLTVWNAVTGAEGEGATFWTAVVIVVGLLAICSWFTVRVVRRLASGS
jgi:hypothetical protein